VVERVGNDVVAAVRGRQAEHEGRADQADGVAHRHAGQAADVGDLPFRGAQAIAFQSDDMRQVVDILDHHAVLEEGLDVGERHRRDRIAAAGRGRRGGQDRPLSAGPVEVGEADHVAREQAVRVLDLRIGLPDLRPPPRFVEELGGDAPQRVATLDRVGRRMTLAQFRGGSVGRHRQQRSGGDCMKPLKHGGYPPDFPRR